MVTGAGQEAAAKKKIDRSSSSSNSNGKVEGKRRSDSGVGKGAGSKKQLHNNSKCHLLSEENENRLPPTPIAADQEENANRSSTARLCMSTPRTKRCGMLANLHSDLSPKYIGFTTPPSEALSKSVAMYGSEGRCAERVRMTRRRNLMGATMGSGYGDCDATFVSTTLGCIRRTRSSNSIAANKEAVASPEKLPRRKPFVSPIDKLLARNGSTVATALDGMLSSTVLESLEPKVKTHPIEKVNTIKAQRNVFASENVHVADEELNVAQKKSNTSCLQNDTESEAVIVEKVKLKHEKHDLDFDVMYNPVEVIEDNNRPNAEHDMEKNELPHAVDTVAGIDTTERSMYTTTPIAFDNVTKLDLMSSISAKSPSALSLDSAKGSSVVTGMAWMSFSTGDLFWGRIYSYCYWPCMVCPDPDDRTITTDRSGRHGDEHFLVHVRFFADNGRRNWVKRDNLKPYTGLDNFKQYVREMRDKYGRKNPKYKVLLPKQSQVQTWREAVREANMVAEVLYSERLEKFHEIYEQKKTLQKLERKRRQSNSNPNSLQDSADSLMTTRPLTTIKRNRSASPFSPAYSPLKAMKDIKKRRVSNLDDREPEPSTSHASLFGNNTRLVESSQNNSLDSSVGAITGTSISSTYSALQDVELINNTDFKKFYNIMKDFVMEQNEDVNLERSLRVAVRNIWGLKQINRNQMERRLMQSFNEQELGSSLIEQSRGEGSVKRLSNRLRNIMIRRSLPAATQTHERYQKQEQMSVSTVPKPKRQLNRPIEEVIDDIFNLDSKYLFRGMGRDPVCKYCFRPDGQLEKCSKGCQTWLHRDCIRKSLEVAATRENKRRSRKRSKAGANDERVSEYTKSTEIDHTTSELPSSQGQLMVHTHLPVVRHITADGEANSIGLEIVCRECTENKPLSCVVCNHANEDNSLEPLVACNMPQCSKTFHPSCCRYWPQAKVTKSKNKIESFRCPSHVCHTCVSDDPKGKFQHLSSAKLTRCVKCPASYHTDSTCIPAGSQILTAAHIICPRHNSSKSDAHVNVSWCFICVGGGQVVCCETCPTAVHAECLNIPMDPHEGYICEECESGRMPLYGEMVWAKFNSFRWWPALILPPSQVPQNIMRKTHNASDFVVRFFGTHDHGWISRRRVYLYLEGDSSEPPRTKSNLDQSYKSGVEEAKRIYEIIKLKKQAQRLSNEDKEKLHPQPYVRIKANRAVFPVKLHIDLDKVSKCECRPDDENPCGPDSNCLNRVLYHECNPKLCPAGTRCQNQMFESRVSPRLDVVYMKERGFGLVCREQISAGTFIIEYVGEVINDDEFQQRMAQMSTDRDENFYFLSVEKDYIIDAGPKGNLARFMNHSCDPNCETQKWIVNGLNRVGLFAIKDIPANTELTFNYHWDDLLGAEKKTCFCGAGKCAGQIGGKYKEEKMHKELEDIGKVKVNNTRKTKSVKRQSRTARSQESKKSLPIKVKLRSLKRSKARAPIIATTTMDNSAAAAGCSIDVDINKVVDNIGSTPSEDAYTNIF